ncbi:hypothetical protein TNCV_1352941 [Trichonephila clavipes]|nr:hypothetical protein TNCV_1352941 [Trichonephila clavipes]
MGESLRNFGYFRRPGFQQFFHRSYLGMHTTSNSGSNDHRWSRFMWSKSFFSNSSDSNRHATDSQQLRMQL